MCYQRDPRQKHTSLNRLDHKTDWLRRWRCQRCQTDFILPLPHGFPVRWRTEGKWLFTDYPHLRRVGQAENGDGGDFAAKVQFTVNPMSRIRLIIACHILSLDLPLFNSALPSAKNFSLGSPEIEFLTGRYAGRFFQDDRRPFSFHPHAINRLGFHLRLPHTIFTSTDPFGTATPTRER